MRRLLHDAQEPILLNEGVAAEIAFTPAAPLNADGRRSLAASLRKRLGARPVDVAVLPAENRRKRLFLADMDSTMIRQECIDELAAEIGLKDHIAAITARAMRGEIAFEPALRERVALLKGLPADVVERVIATRIELTPGGETLVATLRANGAHTALVSGGFTVFTGPIAARIGFDEHRSNVLDIDGGKLAGTVREPILGQQAKRDALIELRTRLRLAPAETLAVGDGANDLAMLGEAGLGVALHAKPKVAEAAQVRIDHGDLTALLYLQGYAARDFVG
jgi:phosphoserine phosphatase